MNHSIYSADRIDPPQDRGGGAWLRVSRWRASASRPAPLRTTATRLRASSRPARPWRSPVQTHRWCANDFFEFTRLFTSPPRSPREYVEGPNYPQVGYFGKRPLPTGVFFLCNAFCKSHFSYKACSATGSRIVEREAQACWNFSQQRSSRKSAFAEFSGRTRQRVVGRSRSACRQKSAPTSACRPASRRPARPSPHRSPR